MICRLTVAVLCVLGSVAAARAQGAAAGSVRGYVQDEQGAVLPGVTITATSPSVGPMFTATTDGEGLYRLLDLPPAEYTLTAELQGFSKVVRERVQIRAGLNLTLDLVLKVGNVTETVTVSVDAPILESKSAAQTVNISGEFQKSLPITYGNHWSNFMAITPGLAGNQLSNSTSDSFSARGAPFDAHVMQFDGADMSGPSQGTPFFVNFAREAVADIEVKLGAQDAASPLGIGLVMNVATKSGTNEFRGAGSLSFQMKEWTGNNLQGGTVAAPGAFLPELALGGPIVRDRFWFFTSYRHETVKNGIARTPAQIATLQALSPDFEPFDTEIKANQLFAKANARFGQHQAEFFYNRGPQDRITGSQTDEGPYSIGTFGGEKNFAGRVNTVWGSSLTTRFGASYNSNGNTSEADLSVPSTRVYSGTLASGGRLTGTGMVATLDNTSQAFYQDHSKVSISGDLTYYRAGWIGNHEFQTGFLLQPRNRIEIHTQYVNFAGGFSFQDAVLRNAADPSAGYIPFHKFAADQESFLFSHRNTSDLGVYLQDAWRPTDRLTLNVGLRVDVINREDKLFGVDTMKATEIGPRFGVNYAVTADRHNIARASWVRVHAAPTGDSSAGSSTITTRDFYDLDLNGSFETEFVTPGVTALTSNRVFDPERGQPYVDELSFGFRRQFPGRVMVDATFTRREFRDRTGEVDQNGIYVDNVFQGYKDERFNEIFLVTNNRWNWPVYSGLEFQVTKETAKVQLIGAYTYTWRHMEGTFQPNDPALFIQPQAFPNDTGVGSSRTTTSNSLSGTADLDNFHWRDHVFRSGVTYFAPWQLILGATYAVQSGQNSGPVVMRLPAGDPAFGPPTIRLSNGRVVSNPLSTPIRFAYPTRGEGQLMTPVVHLFNVRVGRSFVLGAQRRLELSADVLNLPNAGAGQSFQSGGNQQYSTTYGLHTTYQSPRSARFSARFTF